MPDEALSELSSENVFYQADDGRSRIQVLQCDQTILATIAVRLLLAFGAVIAT